MSRLQLLITQYRETEEIIKPMLDSIESQIDIDLKNDIEVIIGNDGSDVKLSKEFLEKYSFPIQYHLFEHSRLAGCRKRLYHISTAEYIMFCDGDDRFVDNLGIRLILNEMNDPFDYLRCDFYRDWPNEDGSFSYKIHSNDDIHVHGLVLRREFLEKNQIEWHEELYENQDCPYVALTMILAKKQRSLHVPVYLWKYYPDSVSVKDGDMRMPKQFAHYIDTFDFLVTDLKDRGYGEYAKHYVIKCLYLTHSQLKRRVWYRPESEQHRIDVYKRIAAFYRKYQLLLVYAKDAMFEKAIDLEKKRLTNISNPVSLPPIEEWLQSILVLFPDS